MASIVPAGLLFFVMYINLVHVLPFKVNSDPEGKYRTLRTFIIINQHLLELICYCAIKIFHLVNANFGIKEICKQRHKEPCSLFPFQNNIDILGLIDLFPSATVKILDLNFILFLFYTKWQNVIMFSPSAQEIKNKWFPYLYQNRTSKSCNTKEIKLLGHISRIQSLCTALL